MWQAPWNAPRTVPYRQEDPAAGVHQVVNKNPIHPTGRDRPDPAAIKSDARGRGGTNIVD